MQERERERDENATLTTTFLIKEQPPSCVAAAKGVSLRSVADNNNNNNVSR